MGRSLGKKQESSGGRLSSAIALEQAFTNGLAPVFCLAFGYDMLLLIVALSQESLFFLPKSSRSPTILFQLQQGQTKANHEVMCVMTNCLHNSETHKTWEQLYLISQSQLKHGVFPTCSALLHTPAGTLRNGVL